MNSQSHAKLTLAVLTTVWPLLSAAVATAAVTTYTSEASYLSALSGGGYTSIAEGFEDDAAWGGVRSTVGSGFITAPSVTALGITWQSRATPSGITTGAGAAHTGSWGVFSYPHGDPNPTAHVRDGFRGTAAAPIHGVGAWYRGQGTSPQIQIVLDRGMPSERSVGLGGTLTGTPTFLGLIDTVSFTTFEVEELDGTYEDQNFVFADDFTFAVPSGSLGTCGDGVLDLGEQCDDSNTAAGDCCSATCTYESGSCNDGDACTAGDTCSGGSCVGGAPPSCADGNPCTTDSCNPVNGQCLHQPNTVACDDGVFCNGSDTCGGGSCSVHAGDPCAGGSSCANVCNEVGDSCFVTAGTACTSDGNPCTNDQCNGAGICIHANNTAPCDDGAYCNGADTCSGGSCSSHAGNPCPGADGDANCAESCNETSDNCTAADPNGSACNDGAYCNGTDTCASGTCSAHAGDPCALSGLACNETSDSCQSCTTHADCDDLNPCTDDVCAAGDCQYAFNTDPCDDADVCTLVDSCSGGACTGSGSLTCDDLDVCTTDSCDPGVGCQHTPIGGCGTTTTTTTTTSVTTQTTSTTSTTIPSAGACSTVPVGGCHEAIASLLVIRDKDDDRKDKIYWKLARVDAVDAQELGDPTVSTAYALCLYDSRPGGPSPTTSLLVTEGAAWKGVRRGFKYGDKAAASDGVQVVKLLHGSDGKAKAQVRARGGNVPMPDAAAADSLLATAPQVVVQLVNDAGTCWTSTFLPEHVRKSSASYYKAKSN